MKGLSLRQVQTLKKMSSRWVTAYELGVSLLTLESLYRRGLVEKRGMPGMYFYPRTCIYFRLTTQDVKGEDDE